MHSAVAEAAVIAADLTGQPAAAYLTLSSAAVPEAGLEAGLREHVGRCPFHDPFHGTTVSTRRMHHGESPVSR